MGPDNGHWWIERDDGERVAGPFDLADVIAKFTVYDPSEYRMVEVTE